MEWTYSYRLTWTVNALKHKFIKNTMHGASSYCIWLCIADVFISSFRCLLHILIGSKRNFDGLLYCVRLNRMANQTHRINSALGTWTRPTNEWCKNANGKPYHSASVQCIGRTDGARWTGEEWANALSQANRYWILKMPGDRTTEPKSDNPSLLCSTS